LNNLIIFKENAGGIYANNIFINQGYGIDIEYNSDTENCFNHIDNNRLKICNNIFYNVAQNEEDKLLNIFSTQSINLDDQNNSIDAYFLTENNEIRDPGIIMEDDLIELIPMNELTGNKYSLENDWFESVEYKGAFGHYNWAYGWTLLSEQYFNK
jgi:hypothetical protein